MRVRSILIEEAISHFLTIIVVKTAICIDFIMGIINTDIIVLGINHYGYHYVYHPKVINADLGVNINQKKIVTRY
jgi:hypothetical protein